MSFQNWHKEFDKIWLEHSKVSKTFILMSFFWAKYILFELKKYRGIIFHETEEWCKIWRRIDLLFQNWHKEFDKILPEHSKASKIVILMSSFWAKYILFELKKYRRIFFHDTEEWCKIWIITGLLRLENDMRNFAKFPQSTCKCQNWNFDKIFLSKVEIVWASNLQWSCVSWQWRVTQKVKRK